jgi:hypothetical protein
MRGPGEVNAGLVCLQFLHDTGESGHFDSSISFDISGLQHGFLVPELPNLNSVSTTGAVHRFPSANVHRDLDFQRKKVHNAFFFAGLAPV